MTAALFLGFVVVVAAGAIAVAAWRLPRVDASRIAAVMVVWLAYVGTLSGSGVLADLTLRPPAIIYLVAPIVLFIGFGVLRSTRAGTIAAAVPLQVLIAFQSYRVGVELFLHRLWLERLVPQMLTFEGVNVDIAIGVSAIFVAWVATRGRKGLCVALVWNVLGLLALANVVVRSALTSPGPLHVLEADVLNRAIGTFPYTYIAGFLAPLAVVLHVLSLRSIVHALRDGAGADTPPVRPTTSRV